MPRKLRTLEEAATAPPPPEPESAPVASPDPAEPISPGADAPPAPPEGDDTPSAPPEKVEKVEDGMLVDPPPPPLPPVVPNRRDHIYVDLYASGQYELVQAPEDYLFDRRISLTRKEKTGNAASGFRDVERTVNLEHVAEGENGVWCYRVMQ